MPFTKENPPERSPKASLPNVQGLEKYVALAQSDPEIARKLLSDLLGRRFTPHPGQQEVVNATERFLTMCAGRRFGKTKVAAAMVLRKCRRTDAKMVWWVAPTYKIVKRGYAEVLRQLPPELLSKPAPAETAFDAGRAVVLHFKTGARLEFYSAERPEGMLGEGVDFVVMDEAATMPENVWTQIVRPTLADRRGGALFISTPRGRNWFYRMWQRGQDELQTDYNSWRFPSMANPYIPASEWEEMAETLPRAVYEQEILAEFISNAASVFRIPEGAVQGLQEPAGHVILGIDLAKHHDFTVLCGVRSGDRQPCYHERFNAVAWPEQEQRIHRAVEKILQTAESVTLMLDSTGLGDVVYDNLCMDGYDVVPVKFTAQWKEQAVMLLASDLERGFAYLNEHQVKEFEGYSYKISNTTGRWKFEAGSGHDDEVSAMLMAHWGVVNEGVPDVHLLTTGSRSDPSGPRDFLAADHSDEYDVEGTVIEEETIDLRPPSIHQLLTQGF